MVFRRSMRLHINGGRHVRVVYSDQQVATLARMHVKVQEIHFSGYLSKERFLRIVTHYISLEALSVPPWVYERLTNSWWWQRLAGWLKSFVKQARYCRKFWNEENRRFVREMVLAGNPFPNITSHIFFVFNHRIRVVTLIRLAIKLGWLPERKPPPRRLDLPRAY